MPATWAGFGISWYQLLNCTLGLTGFAGIFEFDDSQNEEISQQNVGHLKVLV
jgi:hypothetical protein